jgi:DNA repair protein RecN (Recombination protein N)
MLKSLTVSNFVFIDELQVSFEPGFTIITGETGAGKSILLGALSLLLGGRADSNSLLDKSRKCVVEGVFDVSNYQLKTFFVKNELEFDNTVIIRREILENGRSRAFINDSPVALNVLKDLTDSLIDIHSQHQNLLLTVSNFHLDVIDTLAGNEHLLDSYAEAYKNYCFVQTQLEELKTNIQRTKAEADVWQHQFEMLDSAKLKEGELKWLEEQCEILSNAEELKLLLDSVSQRLSADEIGVLSLLKDSLQALSKLKSTMKPCDELYSRTDSTYIELKDITLEIENLNNKIELDPDKLSEYRLRLDMLYGLVQRFRVQNDTALIAVRNELENKLKLVENSDEALRLKMLEVEAAYNQTLELSHKLTETRAFAIPVAEKEISLILQELGMPNAVFVVEHKLMDELGPDGSDKIVFLFSSNKVSVPQDIAKVASGGELSRLMLAIKSVMARKRKLPTIVFDEIDTGVSGEVAGKLGNIIRSMSKNMQILDITHLPQIAARGEHHFLVYKQEDANKVNTYIRKLNHNERIEFIARMLSGDKVTSAALEHASQLLEE